MTAPRRLLLALALLAGPALAQGALAQGAPAQGAGLPGMTLPGSIAPSMPAPLPDDENPSASAPQASPDVTAPGSQVYTGTGLPPVPGSTPPITCPIVHGGRLLASSDVYDGPPLRGNLVPQRNRKWHLKPHDWPGNAYYLSCEYGYDRPPLGIRLPARVKTCIRPNGDPVQVACK